LHSEAAHIFNALPAYRHPAGWPCCQTWWGMGIPAFRPAQCDTFRFTTTGLPAAGRNDNPFHWLIDQYWNPARV